MKNAIASAGLIACIAGGLGGCLSASDWASMNSSVPVGNYTSAPSASSSNYNGDSNQSVKTLEWGTYALSGTNLQIQLAIGLCSLSIGGKPVGSASYTQNSNGTVSLSFFNTTDEARALNGNTYVYNVANSTTFYGNGERWVKVR